MAGSWKHLARLSWLRQTAQTSSLRSHLVSADFKHFHLGLPWLPNVVQEKFRTQPTNSGHFQHIISSKIWVLHQNYLQLIFNPCPWWRPRCLSGRSSKGWKLLCADNSRTSSRRARLAPMGQDSACRHYMSKQGVRSLHCYMTKSKFIEVECL